MKTFFTLLSYIKSAAKDLLKIHKYSKDILHGSFQFTIVLYLFSGIIYFIAPYTSDYIQSIKYYQGALEIAPVVLASGVVSALLCDLVMRKSKPGQAEKDTSDEDKNK